MCNLNDFVCCIPQMKREFRASFHQSTKFPTSIDRQTWLYGTFAPMCNWFKKKSPTHTFAVDCETWHCKWAAPCYFNGALPTGSLRWGYCLQWHLACEGLYWDGPQVSLFHTPTGSAHSLYTASVVSLKDALIGWRVNRLWRVNSIVTYSNKHREYCAVSNMTCIGNMT